MVAHTISNPRTVMVHLGHTHSAVRTVVTAFWLPLLALSAHFNFCVLRNCRNLLGSLEWCNPVAWKSHKDCEVKSKLKNSLIHLVFNPCIQLVVGEIQRTRIKKADKQPHAINKESVFHRPAAHWAEKLVAALTKSVHFRINSKNNAILIIRTAVCLFKILWINIVLLLRSIWNRFWRLNWFFELKAQQTFVTFNSQCSWGCCWLVPFDSVCQSPYFDFAFILPRMLVQKIQVYLLFQFRLKALFVQFCLNLCIFTSKKLDVGKGSQRFCVSCQLSLFALSCCK